MVSWQTCWLRGQLIACIAVAVFFSGCHTIGTFVIEDSLDGVFVYSGTAIEVDTVVVQKFRREAFRRANAIREQAIASGKVAPNLRHMWQRKDDFVWIVRADQSQDMKTLRIQYGVVPPGFKQIWPREGPAPPLTRDGNYLVYAGRYRARLVDGGIWLDAPGDFIGGGFSIQSRRFVDFE